jgi:hypothetical protein
VLTETPPVADLTDGRTGDGFGDLVVGAPGAIVIDVIHVTDIEPRQFDLKVEVKQTLKLHREDFFVPSCQFSQPVISDHVGALLGGREM